MAVDSSPAYGAGYREPLADPAMRRRKLQKEMAWLLYPCHTILGLAGLCKRVYCMLKKMVMTLRFN